MNKNYLKYITIFLLIITVFYIGFIIQKSNNNELKIKEIDNKLEGLNDFKEEDDYDDIIIVDKFQEDEIKQKKEDSNNFNLAISELNQDLCNNISDKKIVLECEDNVFLAKAFKFNDRKYCLEIKDIGVKSNCEDDFTYNEALKSRDYKTCDKLSINSNLIENCKSTVIFEIIEDVKYSGNKDICNQLDEGNKKYCIRVIDSKKEKVSDIETLNKAIVSTDINSCYSIGDTNLKNACTDNLNLKLSINENDKKYCSKILDSSKKNSCNSRFNAAEDKENFTNAINNLDIYSCYKINSQSLLEKCENTYYIKSAIKTKNKVQCSSIKDNDLKEECNSILDQLLKK